MYIVPIFLYTTILVVINPIFVLILSNFIFISLSSCIIKNNVVPLRRELGVKEQY